MRNCRNQAANPRPQEVSGAQEQSPQVMQWWQCQPGHLPATLGKAQQTRGTSTSFSFFSVCFINGPLWTGLNIAKICMDWRNRLWKWHSTGCSHQELCRSMLLLRTYGHWASQRHQQRNSDTAGKGQPNPPRYELVSAQRSPGERQ